MGASFEASCTACTSSNPRVRLRSGARALRRTRRRSGNGKDARRVLLERPGKILSVMSTSKIRSSRGRPPPPKPPPKPTLRESWTTLGRWTKSLHPSLNLRERLRVLLTETLPARVFRHPVERPLRISRREGEGEATREPIRPRRPPPRRSPEGTPFATTEESPAVVVSCSSSTATSRVPSRVRLAAPFPKPRRGGRAPRDLGNASGETNRDALG